MLVKKIKKERIFILGVFFLISPIFYFLNFFLLQRIVFFFPNSADNFRVSSTLNKVPPSIFQEKKSNNVLAAIENVPVPFSSLVVGDEARPLIIKNYLEKYHSPLASYSELIFKVSQTYGLDYRLIVAIAQQESNLCKKAPPDCFNCWGVGIHSRGTLCFSSYEEAIWWFGKYLKEEYYDKGLNTPEEIMVKYCPLSNGSWAYGVNQFMSEMQ